MRRHFKLNNNKENLIKAHRKAVITGMNKIADYSKENSLKMLL
jgi:hypothetical protein